MLRWITSIARRLESLFKYKNPLLYLSLCWELDGIFFWRAGRKDLNFVLVDLLKF
jgi:hypothetical protein